MDIFVYTDAGEFGQRLIISNRTSDICKSSFGSVRKGRIESGGKEMGKQQSIKSFFRPAIKKEGECKDCCGLPVVGEGGQQRGSTSVVPVVDATVEDEPHTGRSLEVESGSDKRLRHDKWQAKMLGEGHVMGRRWGGSVAGGTKDLDKSPEQHSNKQKKKELTPLEQQVVELQEKYHPDCVLVIECGYKYRFFGRDAEIANNVLGIFSYVSLYA